MAHFTEGGTETVSRFLVANCLDRLHVVVAPIIIGSGRPSLCARNACTRSIGGRSKPGRPLPMMMGAT